MGIREEIEKEIESRDAIDLSKIPLSTLKWARGRFKDDGDLERALRAYREPDKGGYCQCVSGEYIEGGFAGMYCMLCESAVY